MVSLRPLPRNAAKVLAGVTLGFVLALTASFVASSTTIDYGPLAPASGSSVAVELPNHAAGDDLFLACQGRRNAADFSAPGYASIAAPYGPSGLRIEILHQANSDGLSQAVTVTNADAVNGWSCVAVAIGPLDGIGAPAFAKAKTNSPTPAAVTGPALAFTASFTAGGITFGAGDATPLYHTATYATSTGVGHSTAGAYSISGSFQGASLPTSDWWGAVTVPVNLAAAPTATPTPVPTPTPTPAPTLLTMAAGDQWIIDCATGITVGETTANEVTLTCASPPTPTATPTATPVPTTAPTVPPTSTPTPVPTATVAPTPTPTPPTSGSNVSGIVIPAPLPGYQREHFTEFPNTQTLGNPPHPDTLQHLQPRPDVARDCTYNDSSGRGRYCWKATTSEHDGVLDMWLHTETGSCKTSGFTHQHNGNGGCNYVAGPKWTLPNQSDFVISYVAKLDDIPGRKVAYLRWCGPKIGTPGYCEDNFVEGKLTPGPRGNAFHHLEGSKSQQQVALNIQLDEWHLYQMHVKPGQFVDFYLDGKLVLHATQGVSSSASYWVFQSETYLGGQTIPIPHNQGHLLLDSFAVDLPSN